MAAPYSDWRPLEIGDGPCGGLAKVAVTLSRPGQRLSPLVMMTDPERTPDPVAASRSLPRGGALIYRHFGTADRNAVAQQMRTATRAHGQQLLIANDPELALAVGADGLHCPRDADFTLARDWVRRAPGTLLSASALKSGDYRAPFPPLDALFVSPVFASRSRSAGTPLGLEALKDWVARLPVPVYALGGINAVTAAQLRSSGVAGFAAVDGFERNDMQVEKEVTERGHRFLIHTEAGEAELTLARVEDGVFNANHTFTPTALRGQGVAGKLYAAMVADAKSEGYRIIPGCPYVEVKFKRHPEDRAAVGV